MVEICHCRCRKKEDDENESGGNPQMVMVMVMLRVTVKETKRSFKEREGNEYKSECVSLTKRREEKRREEEALRTANNDRRARAWPPFAHWLFRCFAISLFRCLEQPGRPCERKKRATRRVGQRETKTHKNTEKKRKENKGDGHSVGHLIWSEQGNHACIHSFIRAGL